MNPRKTPGIHKLVGKKKGSKRFYLGYEKKNLNWKPSNSSMKDWTKLYKDNGRILPIFIWMKKNLKAMYMKLCGIWYFQLSYIHIRALLDDSMTHSVGELINLEMRWILNSFIVGSLCHEIWWQHNNNQINLMKFIKTRDNFDQVKVQGYIVLLEVQGVINTGARGSRDKL